MRRCYLGVVIVRWESFADLDARTWHDLSQLRVDVFVVEQNCPYREFDGRDIEPDTRHVWIVGGAAHSDGDEAGPGPRAYLRVMTEPDGSHRIGRVATRERDRGQGLARELMSEVLERVPGTLVLDAQTHLGDWYGDLGFCQCGEEYVEDAIPHIPMKLTR